MKNPLRPIWDRLLWWPLRGLMPRPVCQTMDDYWREGAIEARVADNQRAVGQAFSQHPYRHPEPHSHAGVDECFVCNEHAEATGCVTPHHKGLSREDFLLLQDPDTWDFG